MAVSRSLLEITICDAHNRVLLSAPTLPAAPAIRFPTDYPDYSQLARHAGSGSAKIRGLSDQGARHVLPALPGRLGSEGQKPDLYVRVVILPALIRSRFLPELQKAAVVSLLSIIGSISDRARVFQFRVSTARAMSPRCSTI